MPSVNGCIGSIAAIVTENQPAAANGQKRPLDVVKRNKTHGDNAGSVGKARRSIDRQPNQDTAAPSRNPTRIVSAVGTRE